MERFEDDSIPESLAQITSGGLIEKGVGMLAVGVASQRPDPQQIQEALDQAYEAGHVSIEQAVSGRQFLDMATAAQSYYKGAGELYTVLDDGSISYFFTVDSGIGESGVPEATLKAMVSSELYDHAALQARMFEGNKLIRQKAKPVHAIIDLEPDYIEFVDLLAEMVSRMEQGEFSEEDKLSITTALALIRLDREDIFNGRYVQFNYNELIDSYVAVFFPNGYQK